MSSALKQMTTAELRAHVASYDAASDYGLGYQLAAIELQSRPQAPQRTQEPNSDLRMLYGCHWE